MISTCRNAQELFEDDKKKNADYICEILNKKYDGCWNVAIYE